jgi:hypothetical protein
MRITSDDRFESWIQLQSRASVAALQEQKQKSAAKLSRQARSFQLLVVEQQ